MKILSCWQRNVILFVRFVRQLKRKLPNNLRTVSFNYFTLFAGDFSRLLIQTLYFLLLANTLALSDMGIFAAVLSVGTIIGSTIGLGYSQLAYRIIVKSPSLLGNYLAGIYFTFLLTLPIALVISGVIYMLVFSGKLPFVSFLEVMLVELLLWRLVETFGILNQGLGYFSRTMKGLVLSFSFRGIAAFLFWSNGYTELTIWIDFYLFANILAFIVVWVFFRPQTRLRLHIPLIFARLRSSFYLGFANLMFCLQHEIDKVIILLLAGNEITGIYAISMRILSLISMPIQVFFSLYIRNMLKKRKTGSIVRNSLMVEAGIFIVAIVGFLVLMQILRIAPNILGSNVAAAKFFYSGLLFLPAFKILVEFHTELYFIFGHIKDRALASIIIGIVKTFTMILIVVMAGSVKQWTPWMNLSYAFLYLLSLGLVYPVLTGWVKNIRVLPLRLARELAAFYRRKTTNVR